MGTKDKSNLSRNEIDKLTKKILDSMNYAIYQGGLSTISLKFCIERNNKVFSREEIESWRHLDFEGKPENFDPFECNACVGCNHWLDWISDDLAKILKEEEQ